MDIVFASFIRKASDVSDIRKELGEKGKNIFIVSKVWLCPAWADWVLIKYAENSKHV